MTSRPPRHQLSPTLEGAVSFRRPDAPASGARPHVRGATGLRLVVALAAALYAGSSSAATASLQTVAAELPRGATVDAETLRVVWRDAPQAPRRSDEDHLALVKEVCRQLASRLLIGRGPWGLGVFSDYECWRGATRLFGKTSSPPHWTLEIRVRPGRWQLAVFHGAGDAGDGTTPLSDSVAVLEIDATPQTPIIAARDQLFTAALAAALLDGLPMAARLGGEGTPIKSAAAEPSFVTQSLRHLAPGRLQAFHLRSLQSERLFIPELVGLAEPALSGGKRSPPSSWRLAPGGKAPSAETVFAQRVEGPGRFTAQLLAIAEGRQAKLASKLASAERFGGLSLDKIGPGAKDLLDVVSRNSVSSGYVGLRVGRELVAAGAAVLPPAMLIGVIGEFRAGLMDGLRIYYDEVPATTDDTSGEAFYLGYSRFVLGFAFDFELPCPKLLGRCLAAVSPKAGLWSFESRLPVAAADGTVTPVSYATRRAFSYGYELALESERLSGLTRLWHAADTSLPVVDRLIPSSVTSRRFGIDAFFDGPRLPMLGSGWRWSFLLFSFLDIMDVEGSYEPSAASAALIQSAGETQRESYVVTLMSTFGGVGVSTSW
jgi:hypothetical protein